MLSNGEWEIHNYSQKISERLVIHVEHIMAQETGSINPLTEEAYLADAIAAPN